jgi:cellulose synthase operon protein C
MVKVECDGCKAPYQIDEKRIPPTGLKMRCPKCGTNLLVTRPSEPRDSADLPAVPADLPAVAARSPAGSPGAPPRAAPPRAPPKAPPRPPPPPPAARVPAPAFEIDTDLPAMPSGFGEIELMVDLPAPAAPADDDDLPALRGAAPSREGAPRDLGTRAPAEPAPPSAPPEVYEEADLPSVHGGNSDLPLPAAHGARATGPRPPHEGGSRPQPPGPPPRKPNPTVSFGNIDLPAAPEVDLPAPVAAAHGAPPAVRPRGRTVNFGDIDLPSVPEDAGLPLAAPGGGFGEIDLPLVSHEQPGLPSPAGAGFPMATQGAGLPMVSGGAGLPMSAHDAGLPMPARGAGLPVPAHGAGLPMSAQGAGLPMPAHGAGLPMPAQGAGFPVAAHGSGLPMPAQGAGFPVAAHGSGLPMPAQGAGFPVAAPGSGLPMPAQGAGFPMAAPGSGFPMPAQGQGFPVAMPGSGYPMPAQGQGFPMAMPGGDLPMPAGADYPSRAFGDIGLGEEIALDDAPQPRSNAFDDSDRAVPSQMDLDAPPLDAVGIDLAGPARATVGDEADLAAAPSTGGDAASQVQLQRRPREGEAPVKKSNARRAALVVGVLLTLTGGALAMVPAVGPFGVYLISDQINAKKDASALEALRGAVGAQLDEDTHAAVSAAIDHCKAGRLSMPRYRPAAAYCADVVLERGLRFGRRTDDEALARQLLTAAADGGGDATALATAELDALAGQLAKARGPVAAIAQRAPEDVDAAVVAADVELADKAAAKAALAAWQRAVSVKKSARTLFGLARAQLAVGDSAAAEASARAALAASSAHAGARTLVAGVIWPDVAREADALTLLKQVTEGDAGKAASEGELVDAFTQIGLIHLARSRISAAEQAFAAALKRDPLAVRALVGDGELLYRSGRYSEALARYEAATKADPEDIVSRVGTGKTWIALERMKEAKDMLKKLRETRPGEPLVCLWLGHAEEALGNKKDAQAAYVEAIKVGGGKPEVVDAYVALAQLLSSIGHSDDATAQLAEASKKFPDSPALHRAKGEVALQVGRYEDAKIELEAALAKVDDLAARFRLGVALRRMRHFEEARAVFEQVAAIDKDFPGLPLEYGLLCEETGQSDKALAAYGEALKKAPNDVDLKLRVGSTQVMAGHPREALKMLDEVRKERPNSAEANHFLGRALLLLGMNLAGAMSYLEVAVNIDSNRADYYLYVGWAANELGQPTKAAPALNKAIELDHELGDAYWQRGLLLQKQGATQDALRDLTTALEKRPSRFEAWAAIALCDEDLQKWAEAEQAWRHAIAGNDEVPEWHHRLGKLLTNHGNRAAALPELEKAVELAEKPDEPVRPWLFDAHFLLGEALRGSPAAKAKAIEHYRRFLQLAPHDNAYVPEAQKALVGLGARDSG